MSTIIAAVDLQGVSLRTELALRGLAFSASRGLLHARTDGPVPGVIFGRDEQGRHGNFHPLSYARIEALPAWARRLDKAHVSGKRARLRADWRWRELDCAHSSDALLMNIFCHPEVPGCPQVCALLGTGTDAVPEYGFKPRTPLANSRGDNTELDMRLGNLLVEAKLTESGFQRADLRLVSRYRDFEEVFDVAELPIRNGVLNGYQLVRGALAAHAAGGSFCVLSDARRPELIEQWYQVIRAVRLFDLRCRLKVLTWQELAGLLPEDLQEFLEAKYGIVPTF